MDKVPDQLERILALLIELRKTKQKGAQYKALIEKIRVLSTEFRAAEQASKNPKKSN
jgi:hypothetical protein